MSCRLVSRPPRPNLHVGRAHVLGEDRRGRAVARPDVADHRVVAGTLGMVVDHDVHREHACGRALAEHRRLHVDQRERVELGQLVGRHGADLDAERAHHRDVLGPLHLAERDQRCGRAPSPEHRAQRIATRDPVRVGIGLEQDADLLAPLEQRAHRDHAAQVAEHRELVVDIVADQRAQAGGAQARMRRQLARVDRVREQQHRRLGRGLRDDRHRRPRERRVLGDERVLVARGRAELRDRLVAESARQHVEALGARARRLLATRHPGEHLVLARADPAPQARGAKPVAHDEPAHSAPQAR